MGKYGIKETMDYIEYADAVVDKIVEAKQDDGKINTSEIIGAIMSTTPEAIKAMIGSDDVDNEMADLDPAEKEKLLNASMAALKKLVRAFVSQAKG